MSGPIYEIIETFPLKGGEAADGGIGSWDEARYQAELEKAAEEAKTGEFADLARMNELVAQSPAAAAACAIGTTAYDQDTFPLVGFQHRTWPASLETDDYATVMVGWVSEGHVYQLSMSFNVITGAGQVDLEVDKEPVLNAQVMICGWDKPPRIDGTRPAEDLASPDGKIYGQVTGGYEYEPGPWEAVLTAIGEQLRQLQEAA